MKSDEAKEILAGFRPGTADEEDLFFEAALKLASSDPDLALWFSAEQAFDAALSGKVQEATAPPGLLREKILAARPPESVRSWTFSRAVALAGMAAVVTFLFSMGVFYREPSPPLQAKSVEQFREEMISFVRLPPSLDFKADRTAPLVAWMQKAEGPVPASWPAGLQSLAAVGCRTLMFNGRTVALFCFDRGDGQLAHLFVVDRSAFSEERAPDRAQVATFGEFASALWSEGEKVYLLASVGDTSKVREFL